MEEAAVKGGREAPTVREGESPARDRSHLFIFTHVTIVVGDTDWTVSLCTKHLYWTFTHPGSWTFPQVTSPWPDILLTDLVSPPGAFIGSVPAKLFVLAA